MKNKYRILKIFVVLVLLAFLLNFSLKRFSTKEQKLKIDLTQETPVYFINEATVQSIVKKSNPSGKVGTLDIPQLEKKLNALKAVDSANVYLNLNGVLNVDVKQRVPVMRINNGTKQFYVDKNGEEFPLSDRFSYPCILVSGDIPKEDYKGLSALIDKIGQDDFNKKYFVGINKDGENYELLTDEGNFKVQLGDLDNIDFKLKGFKTFAERYLIYQDPMKYRQISVKYNNQVVTTLRKGFKSDADSLLSQKIPNTVIARPTPVPEKKAPEKKKAPPEKKVERKTEKPKKEGAKKQVKEEKNKKRK
ncbi:cell division protein FtsQ/DivIB [Elizabethkingia meningoseptica]|uniref:cell division protein FtsQ/DivIB n=1 Tax=Elizabethkingia meningoseptica TaxID=238 RepID=UPI002011375F|nr:cell division protein FtsQ [Elizabethkingia meningoseptica]MCL1675802.1 cell division protein FtsQ [Elizabethkingia meningoseptica]MCL1686517.1 cell division protein FtsQ [Elizabethkingia meningoseptica]